MTSEYDLTPNPRVHTHTIKNSPLILVYIRTIKNSPVHTHTVKNESAPVHLAASLGHLSVLKCLITAKADATLLDMVRCRAFRHGSLQGYVA